MTAPTSPKPHTPADPTVSKDASTTLDNGAADAGLRTALTKLADEWDDWPGGYGEELRALLAAHPTSPPVDADVIRKFIVAEFEFDDEIATEQAQRLARALLAAHPAQTPVRSGHDIACDADYLDASCICDEITPAPVSATRREDERLGAKYRVERTSDPTGKHEECGYFVLDPRHDPHAVTAIRAYSAAVRSERPALADDLDAWVGAPMSDTRREDVAAAIDPDAFDLRHGTGAETAGHVVVRRLQAHQAAQRVLAVLPASPVVDEAEVRLAATDECVYWGGSDATTAFVEGAVFAARLRGATRG